MVRWLVVAVLVVLGHVFVAGCRQRRGNGVVVVRVSEVEIPAAPAPVLNALELCDARSCNAQARVRVYMRGTVSYIQFCGHHADEQPDSLYAAAEYVLNEKRFILGGV